MPSEKQIKYWKSMIGKKQTQETKDKMCLAKSRENNPMFGKKHTKEANEKKRKSMIGKNAGENNSKWKGGAYQNANGRWIIYIDGIKYKRARYIAMKCLGRELLKGETVHHINGIKSDDKPENLYLFATRGKHTSYHFTKNKPILISNLTA